MAVSGQKFEILRPPGENFKIGGVNNLPRVVKFSEKRNPPPPTISYLRVWNTGTICNSFGKFVILLGAGKRVFMTLSLI